MPRFSDQSPRHAVAGAPADNSIQLANHGGLLDQGIIFSNVTTSDGKISLSGNANNTISNADMSFFVPSGTTNGSIQVNGNNVP